MDTVYSNVIHERPEAAQAPRLRAGWRAIQAKLQQLEPGTGIGKARLCREVAAETGLSPKTIENLVDNAAKEGILVKRKIPGGNRRSIRLA